MKKILPYLIISSAAALLVACAGDSGRGFDVMSTLQSDADVVVYLDAKKGNTAPITKAFEANHPEADQSVMDIVPAFKEFIESNNLTKESLETFALSISGVGAAIAAEDPSGIRVSGAARISQPLDANSVKAAIEQSAADSGEPITVEVSSHARGEVITFPGEEGRPDLLVLLANEDGGCNLIFATRDELDGAVSGRAANLPKGIRDAKAMALENNYFWMAMVLPEEAKTQLAEMPANPMLGQADAALRTFSALTMSGVATDTLSMRLSAAFGTEQHAKTVQTFVQSSVMPMIMMFAAQAEGGMPPALQSLKFETEGKHMLLGITLTEADLAAFADM